MSERQQTDNNRYWYVMLHLEPSVIDRQLQIENERRIGMGLAALQSIIPFRYLIKATAERKVENSSDRTNEECSRLKDIEDNNSLRSHLHSFVFIQATETEISDLVLQPWNREGRLHLHHYRTKSGRPIRIREEEMAPLKTLFLKQHLRFSFVPYDDSMAEGKTVVITDGLFKNFEASILQINYTAQGARLKLGIPVFNNELMLELHDYDPQNVKVPFELNQILCPSFVKDIEQKLLDILRRRVLRRNNDRSRLEDQATLNSYSILLSLKIEDNATYTHFLALMLLCASLRKDRLLRDRLAAAVRQKVKEPLQPSTDEEAFLLAILFEATRNGEYRRVVKEYCQTHSVVSASLLNLMPLVKKIILR